MSTIINRNDAPSHLFSIPELDLSEDLFAERLNGPWFRLGAWTIDRGRHERGFEKFHEFRFALSPVISEPLVPSGTPTVIPTGDTVDDHFRSCRKSFWTRFIGTVRFGIALGWSLKT